MTNQQEVSINYGKVNADENRSLAKIGRVNSCLDYIMWGGRWDLPGICDAQVEDATCLKVH